jgi:prepilin-type N-terminal cleavage/methylation domain-containing protein/prepilin-type processing-associated H-X9-DG protein
MQRASRSRWAFTLIELLVVIAIIAILAAILFPVFMSAKEKAHMGVCVAHQKELIAAFLMYTDDNNGRTCADSMSGKYWMQILFPYTSSRNPNLYYCASAPNVRGNNDPSIIFGQGGTYGCAWAVTIGMNCCIGDPPTGVWPLKLTEFHSPSHTMVFACCTAKYYAPWWPDEAAAHYEKGGHYCIAPGRGGHNPCSPALTLEANEPRIHQVVTARGWDCDFLDYDRHNGNTVTALLDGHVGVFRTKDLLTAKGDPTDPNYSMWDTR